LKVLFKHLLLIFAIILATLRKKGVTVNGEEEIGRLWAERRKLFQLPNS